MRCSRLSPTARRRRSATRASSTWSTGNDSCGSSRTAPRRRADDVKAPLISGGDLTWDSLSPAVDVIRRGRSEIVERCGRRLARGTRGGPRQSDESGAVSTFDRCSSFRSRSASERFGALTLLALDGRPPYGPDARVLAEKFASHASHALENARLYREARRATEGRDQVLGVVSHDLRNPISAIAMCASALRDNWAADATERENLLTTIVQSTEWMNRLIQDLLDVASIEAGRLSLERRRESASSIIGNALRMFDVEATRRRIELASDAPPTLPTLNVDASRIVQVLGNLLRNALKFTPDGGRIAVRAELRGASVVFAVSDTGPGIPLLDQPRVFDRYWQSRRTANKRGTGLGLSIAKGIVEAHGGRMWLESAPDEGSTFFFSIPAETIGARVELQSS